MEKQVTECGFSLCLTDALWGGWVRGRVCVRSRREKTIYEKPLEALQAGPRTSTVYATHQLAPCQRQCKGVVANGIHRSGTQTECGATGWGLSR